MFGVISAMYMTKQVRGWGVKNIDLKDNSVARTVLPQICREGRPWQRIIDMQMCNEDIILSF